MAARAAAAAHGAGEWRSSMAANAPLAGVVAAASVSGGVAYRYRSGVSSGVINEQLIMAYLRPCGAKETAWRWRAAA